MARIRTETGQDLQAPAVQVAGTSVLPSPIAEFTERIVPVVSALGRAREEAKQAEVITSESKKILSSMNDEIDAMIGAIGPDKTPTQGIAELQGSLNEKLSQSGLKVSQWGAISNQVNDRIATLGKQHFMESNGISGVVDMITGEWRPLVEPGQDISEMLTVSALASLDPTTQLYVEEVIRPNQGDQGVTDFLVRLGRLDVEKTYRDAANQQISFSRNQLGLEEDILKRELPKNKAELFGKFQTDFLGGLNSAFLSTVEGGADPELAFSNYKAEVSNFISDPSNIDLLQNAGFTPASFLTEIEPILNAQKDLFVARSSKTIQKFELEKAELKTKLAIAKTKELFAPRELFIYENAGRFQSLAQTAMLLNTFKENLGEVAPTVTSLMTDGDLNKLITIDQITSPLESKIAESVFASEDPSAYKGQVAKVLQQFNIIANAGEGSITMNSDTLLWMADQIKANPFWVQIKENAPATAAAFEEGEQRIRSILQQ